MLLMGDTAIIWHRIFILYILRNRINDINLRAFINNYTYLHQQMHNYNIWILFHNSGIIPPHTSTLFGVIFKE